MHPSAFDEENSVLDPPKEIGNKECESISVFMGHTTQGVAVTVSCWKVSKEEMEEIQRTGRIWLVVMGHGMPPVHLTSEKPL